MSAETPAELYLGARQSLDDAYLEYERGLLAAGAAALDVLRLARSDDPDPVGRLMAGVLADEIEGVAVEREQVLSTLDAIEAAIANTPIPAPRGDVAAFKLTRRHGPRATRELALYLVKRPGWTPWRAKAALGYLRHHLDPATVPALVRYAAVAPVPHLARHAADTARMMLAPDVVDRMLDELRRPRPEGSPLGAP